VKKDFLFLSLSPKGGKAQFTMRLPFDGNAQASYETAMRETIVSQIRAAAAQGPQSLDTGVASQMPAQSAASPFETLEDLTPKDDDYIFRNFRAISASPINCYGLDFSKPGVLEASTPLLAAQTVYKDHVFWSVDRWVGVVSKSAWDAKGEQSSGVPGINVELKIDWRKDPWIARGLMMTPPAIHSASVTVLFEFEYSHPDLFAEGNFWRMLGEEVDGQIVRLIVTLIIGFWELSLVFQGADELAKQLLDDTQTGESSDELGAKRKEEMGAGGVSPISQRSETVKLSDQLRKMLGLPDTQGEEVADAVLLPALEQLGARAQTGEALLEAARTECLRVAKLAIVGSGEGELPEAFTVIINNAGHKELAGLTQEYTKQAADKFPQTCQSCGARTSGRSSVEPAEAVEQAGGVQKKPMTRPRNSIF
jgi:hypothetical protein